MIRDDGILDSQARDAQPPAQDRPAPAQRAAHPLDSPQSRARLSQLRDWYDQEWDRQAANRYQMAIDQDYYDALQWTEEDAAALLERRQAPVVYNEIKSTVDWMIGTERRTRIDYKVLPRRKDSGPLAEVKTRLLKYLSDANKEPMARSLAFSSACKAGLGWIEVGVRGDPTDEPIFYRAESWRRVLYDSNSVELDLSDARYIFRWRWIDLDVALAYFAARAEILRTSVVAGDTLSEDQDELWYMGARVTEPGYDYASAATGRYRPYDGAAFANNRRARVKLIEAWYRVPAKRKVVRGGAFDGMRFDARSPRLAEALARGECSVYDQVAMDVRCAIYCDAGLLFDGPSPYRHDRFPLVPVWAYRRGRDNAPYGPIRNMRDPQDGMNKRASKALWILSSNQIVMEQGAVDDIELLREEAARPDGVVVRNRGKELEIRRDNALAEQHLGLMDRDQVMIRATGGVTADNLGRQTNASSGRAIVARQEQGGVVTTELFDNHRFAIQLAGEIELSLIEQFFTEEKTIRLVGERGNAMFVTVNERDPATGEVLNDITAEACDFYVSQTDYRDSLRQAMYESLLDIVSRLAQMAPEIAFKMLDLVIELADIPNRDELVARIRQLNGMRDPDSDPTPEEAAAAQQQAQEAATTKQLAIERAQAELAELRRKSDKLDADALAQRLAAVRTSLEAAQTVAVAPALGPIADELVRGAGGADRAPLADLQGAEIARQGAAGRAQLTQQAALAGTEMHAAELAPPGAPNPQPGIPPLPGDQ